MHGLNRLVPYLTFGWAAAILVVSVIPSEELPDLHMWEPDKVFHALFYAILTGLVFMLIQPRRPHKIPLNNVITAALLCILYGFCIECIQLWLPTRSFDIYDVLADSLGCLLAVGIILVISKRKKHPAA